MCSGSEVGSYLRLIDFVYHSTLGLRAIQKKKERWECFQGKERDSFQEGNPSRAVTLPNIYIGVPHRVTYP